MTYHKPNVPSKHFPAFLETIPTLNGKTFVITGTTSGTGRAAADALVRKGARVLMLNRDSARADRVQLELSEAHPHAEISTILCDLQSFDSVRVAAEEIRSRCSEGIYALLNNAGIMAMPDEATVDGFDSQMQTNHLSHFLLSAELFPLLKKGVDLHGESRIVNHSSIARLSVKRLEAKYLERRGGQLGGNGASMLLSGGRWVRYGQTKLANAAFTAALHKRLQERGSKIKALVAHPGFANTELQVTTNRHGGMSGASSIVARLISQSAEDGALGLISCATLPEAQSGDFYGPGKGLMATRGPARPFSLEKRYNNDETIELLWTKSCEAIGRDFDI